MNEDLIARWGLARDYINAEGARVTVGDRTLTAAIAALGPPPRRAAMLPPSIVLREDEDRSVRLVRAPETMANWSIAARGRTLLSGALEGARLEIPPHLRSEVYRLKISDADAGISEATALIIAPPESYQGDPHARFWLLAAQLYGIRSRRNWGHGDFADLTRLLEIAAKLGAAGVGINPLHALLNDTAQDISPYSPSSRLFLNYLYIDVEAVPDLSGAAMEDLWPRIARLRSSNQVDYDGVAVVKEQALRRCHARFRANVVRDQDFERFRDERGIALRKFACFEAWRRSDPRPWHDWPESRRVPEWEALDHLSPELSQEVEFHEYVQWIADRQLRACRDRADELELSIGLYMDLAVGVRPDGADAWSDRGVFLDGATIGAPPDRLNAGGQNWGLTTYLPAPLEQSSFEPLRQTLATAMRYAGAVRVDHVLWLNRVYLIPHGLPPSEGCYLQYPLDALLAVLAIESQANRCIVIGEDLGTVSPELRASLKDWGVWTFHVMQFEREPQGSFFPQSSYKERALATFSTHDLAPFGAWTLGRDLEAKRSIGIDPGESEAERKQAVEALNVATRNGPDVGRENSHFGPVAQFLASTPSRLISVSLEDALASLDLTNVPGTKSEHPNWRNRIPVELEALLDDRRLAVLREIFDAAGRNNLAQNEKAARGL